MKSLKKINWKRLLLDNWGLKLLSLIIAATLWFVVYIVDDPVDEKTFSNIKVVLLNTEQIVENGQIYEVVDNTNVLRAVTVEAPRSVLDKMEPEDIVAEADIDNLSDIETVKIQLSCPKYGDQVSRITGSSVNVKLEIENKKSKWFDIKYNVSGQVADGYMIGANGITLSQNRLEIEGPESKVNRIAKAVVDIDVAGISGDMLTPVAVYLVDETGKQASFGAVTQSVRSVNASVDVLLVKEIPLEFVPTGVPAEGYLPTGALEASPTSVLVAGNAPAINNITEIIVSKELDLTDVESNLELTIDLEEAGYLPPGIIFADNTFDGKVEAIVYVEEEMEKSLRLRGGNLEITGIPDGIFAEVVVDQDMPFLEIRGLARNLESLRESALTGTIDMESWMEERLIETLENGIYYLPVEFQLEEGQTAANEVAVQIQIMKLEEEMILE